MDRRRDRRQPRPLDESSLAELALSYVGRFATTQAKLRTYLARKVRERGWSGSAEPDFSALIERCVRNGFVDDRAFALSKGRALAARGYGEGRLRQTLRAAGVADEDAAPARAQAGDEAVEAALRFARRRGLGPFAQSAADRAGREKALAAMIRAGHGFELARRIVDLAPGDTFEDDDFGARIV